MAKEMTPKEALARLKCSCGSAIYYEDFKLFDTIETALNRLTESEKENALLKENNRSLEELMKRPELELVRENIQLKRDNDLLLINECSARQENKKLEEVLKILKEKNIDMNVVKFCKTYSEYLVFSHLLTETEFNKLKEYFK